MEEESYSGITCDLVTCDPVYHNGIFSLVYNYFSCLPLTFSMFLLRLLLRQELDVGLADGIRVLNITHTGELGYVLYIPNEYALHVYSRLHQAGQKFQIQHAGE